MKGVNSSAGVNERISRSAADGGRDLRCVVKALSSKCVSRGVQWR